MLRCSVVIKLVYKAKEPFWRIKSSVQRVGLGPSTRGSRRRQRAGVMDSSVIRIVIRTDDDLDNTRRGYGQNDQGG
jgi:hypothetical protein